MPNPVVHLELHTPSLARACDFYARALGWWPQRVEVGDASYRALDLARDLTGGVVECGTRRSLWLPYVEVESVRAATERATALGAELILPVREGPAGWRSVISGPDCGELAFWQRKR